MVHRNDGHQEMENLIVRHKYNIHVLHLYDYIVVPKEHDLVELFFLNVVSSSHMEMLKNYQLLHTF